VSYNCLQSYAQSLRGALTQPYPPYESIGIRRGEEYLQLSTTLLQIENEFYGTIRPKQPIRPGERPLHALAERGVEYVEVRLMDLDPFSPIGITAETIRFLDIFLLHCLLDDSPQDSSPLIEILSRNRNEVAERGRDPRVALTRDDGEQVGLAQWGRELLSECEPIAAALDAAHRQAPGAGASTASPDAYRQALALAQEKLADPAQTPSARMLDAVLRNDGGGSCMSFSRAQSLRHHHALLALPLSAEVEERHERMVIESIAAQRVIEAGDTVPFESYRQHYLAQPLLVI
jgi:glutamate--cysteine ligase